MSKEPEIDKIKLKINENYALAKKNMLNKSMSFNISAKNVDELYKNTIKKLDDEYNDFKKQKSHYSIITNLDMKLQKLSGELQKISNNFLVSINPLVDTKSIAMIEEELLQNELNNKREIERKAIEEKNKEIQDEQKDMRENSVMFVVDGNERAWWY